MSVVAFRYLPYLPSYHCTALSLSTNGASAFPASSAKASVGMDAPEERDIKLHKASGNLLSELKTRLPNFLTKKLSSPSEGTKQVVRRRVGRSDTDSLIQLVCSLHV